MDLNDSPEEHSRKQVILVRLFRYNHIRTSEERILMSLRFFYECSMVLPIKCHWKIRNVYQMWREL